MSEDNVLNMFETLTEGGRPKRAPVERRVAWTGLSPEEVGRPGAEMLAALYQKANEDGLNLRELAVALDVTYGYIHQLKTGLRAIPQISDEFATNVARYLKKPKSYVLALAGKTSQADDFTEDTLDGELDTAFGVMYKDKTYGGNMPLSLKSLGRRERLYIVKLYEAASGKKLMPEY